MAEASPKPNDRSQAVAASNAHHQETVDPRLRWSLLFVTALEHRANASITEDQNLGTHVRAIYHGTHCDHVQQVTVGIHRKQPRQMFAICI